MTIDVTYLDSDADLIKPARSAIKAMADWINLAGVLSPEHGGAVGDGVTDDAVALNALLAAGVHLRLTPGKTYLIGAALAPPNSGTWIDARGAKVRLKNGANTHMVRLPNGVYDLTIEGGDWNGNKAAQTGGHGFTSEPLGANSRIRIVNATIHDCFDDGIGWAASSTQYLIEMGNIVYNCGGAGVSHRVGTLSLATVTGNIGYSNGTHNIGSTAILEHVALVGNVGFDAGTADNLTAYNAAGKFISVVGNISKDGDNNGIHFGGEMLIMVGNAVDSPAYYGIAAISAGGATAEGVVIAANAASGSGAADYWLDHVEGSALVGNVSVDAATHGYLLDGSDKYIAVAGNVALRPVSANGFRCENGVDIAAGINVAFGAGGAGLQFTGTVDYASIGNISSHNASAFVESGSSARGVLVGMNQHDNTAGTPSLVSAATIWYANIAVGTANLASAGTITLPAYTRLVVITGTANINTITPTFRDDRCIVKFDSTATFKHATGNLYLSGAADLVGAYKKFVEMVCDGTSWFQAAQSSTN